MNRPILFLFCGQPGSGKTTQAVSLAKTKAIPYYDYDTLVQPFLQAIEREYGVGDGRLAFYAKWRAPSYGTFWAPVLENLKLGISAVVTAPLTRETRDPGFFSALKAQLGADFKVVSIYLAPSYKLHLQMLTKRGSYRDEEILADYDAYKRTHVVDKPCWDADVNEMLSFDDYEELSRSLERLLSEVI